MRRVLPVLAAVLAVAVAAGMLTGCKSPAKTTASTAAGAKKTVETTLLIMQQPAEVASGFRVGDVVKATATNVTIGPITAVHVVPTPTAVGDATGKLTDQPSPITVDIRVVCRQTVGEDAAGYLFPGGRAFVGTQAPYITPLASFNATILSIVPKAQ